MEHLFFLAKLIVCAAVGLWYQLEMKSDSFAGTAKVGKVGYGGFREMFNLDRKVIINTLLAVLFVTLAAGNLLDPDKIGIKGTVTALWQWVEIPKRFLYESFMCVMFGTVGYAGMDIVLRLFSRTKKKITDDIDKKTE